MITYELIYIKLYPERLGLAISVKAHFKILTTIVIHVQDGRHLTIVKTVYVRFQGPKILRRPWSSSIKFSVSKSWPKYFYREEIIANP